MVCGSSSSISNRGSHSCGSISSALRYIPSVNAVEGGSGGSCCCKDGSSSSSSHRSSNNNNDNNNVLFNNTTTNNNIIINNNNNNNSSNNRGHRSIDRSPPLPSSSPPSSARSSPPQRGWPCEFGTKISSSSVSRPTSAVITSCTRPTTGPASSNPSSARPGTLCFSNVNGAAPLCSKSSRPNPHLAPHFISSEYSQCPIDAITLLAGYLLALSSRSRRDRPQESAFDSELPEISVGAYAMRLQKYMNCSETSFALGGIYVDRFFKRQTSVELSKYNIHRFLLTSVVVAAKFIDDAFYTNCYYAYVGGVSLKSLNQMEVHFLNGIDYSLYVSNLTFRKARESQLRVCKSTVGWGGDGMNWMIKNNTYSNKCSSNHTIKMESGGTNTTAKNIDAENTALQQSEKQTSAATVEHCNFDPNTAAQMNSQSSRQINSQAIAQLSSSQVNSRLLSQKRTSDTLNRAEEGTGSMGTKSTADGFFSSVDASENEFPINNYFTNSVSSQIQRKFSQPDAFAKHPKESGFSQKNQQIQHCKPFKERISMSNNVKIFKQQAT